MNKKISLPDVTLLSITSVNIDQTQLALNISSLNIEFAKIKLLSSSLPSSKLPYIEYIQIPKIDFQNLTFPVKSEDVVICHYLYKEMIKQGIKFAPPELAAQFSIESRLLLNVSSKIWKSELQILEIRLWSHTCPNLPLRAQFPIENPILL